jgi:transcriptional regulator with XRE-family HTH domain
MKYDNDMNKFGEKLKEMRTEKKLSQKELAKALEVDQRSISNWETGFRQPDYNTLIRISKYFNVTTDYLLGLED